MKRFLFLVLTALLLVGPTLSLAAPHVTSDAQSPTINRVVPDLATLKATPGETAIAAVHLMGRVTEGDGGEGDFRWLAGDQSALAGVLSDPSEGVFVKLTSPGDGSTGVWVRMYDENIYLQWFGGAVDGATDDTAAINAAFAFAKPTPEKITLDGFAAHASELIFDTSVDGKAVTFEGIGERNSGFLYTGPNNQASQAIRIGTSGVANSGFVRMLQMGVYGQGQTIDGVHIFKGQRWQEFDRFIVRTFDGMGLTAGSGDLFLNTWGDVKLLNLHRAFNLGNEFNANNISNIIIENCGTATTNTRYDATVPIGFVDGIATNINVLSIESCPPDLGIQIENKVTIGALYQEANHTANAGVGARPLIMSGVSPEVLSGNIKLGGFVANEADFFIFDLDDSDRAKIRINVTLPTANPNSYQKPIEFGTSKRTDLDINWQQFDGVGIPSRTEAVSFFTSAVNYKINGAEFIFGMPKEMVGRLLMTEYCLNITLGRAKTVNSSNRPEGFTETNISASSRNGQEFQFAKNRFTAKYSQSAASSFWISSDFTLSNTKRYLFTTFNGRVSTSDPLPRIRVASGSQDFIVSPTNTNFVGWTQTSLVQVMAEADVNPVTFYPFYCADDTGSIYHGMSFIVDLTQFETDFGVSFDGMTTVEIADLIRPDYISSEFDLIYRGTTPDFGAYDRGDIVYTSPPTAGGKIGWIATAAIVDASIDNTAFRTWGDITP